MFRSFIETVRLATWVNGAMAHALEVDDGDVDTIADIPPGVGWNLLCALGPNGCLEIENEFCGSKGVAPVLSFSKEWTNCVRE